MLSEEAKRVSERPLTEAQKEMIEAVKAIARRTMKPSKDV